MLILNACSCKYTDNKLVVKSLDTKTLYKIQFTTFLGTFMIMNNEYLAFLVVCNILYLWWQGRPSGKSTCLPPMWPRFYFHTRCHMWIEFVGSLLCYERFPPGTPVFPSHQKPAFDLICEFDLISEGH